MTNEWKADKTLNWLDTWREIENVYRKHPEKIKAIGMHLSLKYWFSSLNGYASTRTGVSNVSAAYLGDLLKLPNVIVPAVNQVERHPCVQFFKNSSFRLSELMSSGALGRVLKKTSLLHARKLALSLRPILRTALRNRPS
jgi:hypothetical protein